MMETNFKGKVFLVTGATSGIGMGVCTSLLKSGAFVIGVGRDVKKIEHLTEEYSENIFCCYSLDLSNKDNIESIFKSVLIKFGKIDGIVAAVGIEETIPLSLYKPDKVSRIFDINVLSGIELLRIYSKKKFSNQNSSVVFISSVMGELGQPGKVGYCATKSAVLGVVKAAALELSKRNIRVNAISPGVVMTPMTEHLYSQLSEENISEIENMHPLGVGQIEDVVPAILFLLSDNSKWITGQNLKIDGGYSIQ